MTNVEVPCFGARAWTNNLRDALASALWTSQGTMTDEDAAVSLGWTRNVVATVRNRTNTLSLELFVSAAKHTRGAFLAPILALIGLRPVPLDTTCISDAGVQTRLCRLGLKISIANDPASPGGVAITPSEARGMLTELDEFQLHMDRIRALALVAA